MHYNSAGKPMKDETLSDFDESLKEMSVEQNYFNQALNQLSEEINSVTANASCEEIGKLNITEDGYYMIRVEYLSKIDVLYDIVYILVHMILSKRHGPYDMNYLLWSPY